MYDLFQEIHDGLEYYKKAVEDSEQKVAGLFNDIYKLLGNKMSQLDLFRMERTEQGIIGVFRYNGMVVCLSMENTLLSVPLGMYKCHRYDSPKHNCIVWELEDVPNKTNIQIHIANWAHELEGCIGVGEAVDILLGKRAVINSVSAFNRFMEATKDEQNLMINIVEI